jgi:hypothetical protein
MNEPRETCDADGGCCDGTAWTAPSGTLVATYRCVVVQAQEAVDEGSDPGHPMRNPKAVYGRSLDDDEGESVAACNPAWMSVGFMAAHAAAEKLQSMGYRWEWSRSVDAQGTQEGAWVKCEGDAAEIEELRRQLKEARRQACIWAVISSGGTKSAAQRLQDKKAACLVLGWPVEEVWPEDKDVFGEFIESQGKDPAKEDKE